MAKIARDSYNLAYEAIAQVFQAGYGEQGNRERVWQILSVFENRVVEEAQARERSHDLALGNPRFIELNEEELRTHVAKAAGYSGSDNPDTWANFREATAWGVSPAEGCLVRMGDKYRRVQNLRRNAANDQVGESIKDTLMDLSNYAKIAICLIEEEEAAATPFQNLYRCFHCGEEHRDEDCPTNVSYEGLKGLVKELVQGQAMTLQAAVGKVNDEHALD